MRLISGALIFFALCVGFVVALPGKTTIVQSPVGAAEETVGRESQNLSASTFRLVASTTPLSTLSPAAQPAVVKTSSGDIEKQSALASPPAVVKGIYLTAWSAGSASRLNSLIELVKRTELNAVVIDIKDYSGYVSYVVSSTLARDSGALREIRILHPNSVIKRLHDEGIYVIGRITAFQDPILAKARPEWSLKDKKTGELWKDKSGLEWMDPAAEPVWEYLIAIAKDGIDRGFDEINFDYVRFASDGNLSNIEFPFWDGKTPKHEVVGNFFDFLRRELGEAKLSADLFGLTAVNLGDLGIGQTIEDAYESFDYVSPMIYPSHFAAGFLGYQNPSQHPYEVVRYSADRAQSRLATLTTTTIEVNGTSTAKKTITRPRTPDEQFRAKLRPWLQNFNLGAVYDAPMVKKQISALHDLSGSSTEKFAGWLLWNPASMYTEAALQRE